MDGGSSVQTNCEIESDSDATQDNSENHNSSNNNSSNVNDNSGNNNSSEAPHRVIVNSESNEERAESQLKQTEPQHVETNENENNGIDENNNSGSSG